MHTRHPLHLEFKSELFNLAACVLPLYQQFLSRLITIAELRLFKRHPHWQPARKQTVKHSNVNQNIYSKAVLKHTCIMWN